jgi:hypothetical protein
LERAYNPLASDCTAHRQPGMPESSSERSAQTSTIKQPHSLTSPPKSPAARGRGFENALLGALALWVGLWLLMRICCE